MAVCNEKAMHEALESLSAWANIVKNNPKDKTAMECIEFIETVVSAALAEPRRNCDVGTADEQADRFDREYCQLNYLKCGKQDRCDRCFARWAQTPYESEAKDGK